MQAVINSFERNDLSIFNGLTYPIVGHKDGKIMIDIDKEIYLFDIKEVLIVDIQQVYFNSEIVINAIGFDYWNGLLRRYLKVNKILLEQKEIPVYTAKQEIESTFEEQQESEIF